MTRVAPYEKTADVYDSLMRHVDYNAWAEYINRLIYHWHSETKSVLDVSCGTGNLLKMLKKYPFELLGCDFSLSMLKQAKLKNSLDSVPIWRCSMLDLSVNKKADVILCLYDSVNYLMETEKIVKFINNAETALREDGLLIFDICTEQNAIKYFYNFYDHVEQNTFSYDRWSHYDRKSRIQYTEFKVRFDSDPNIYIEKHKQRIYSIRAIIGAITESSMQLIEIYDGFTFQPANSKSNRVHFVLQRGTR